MADWHGWGVGRHSLHVGELPGRKSICLYEVDGSVIRTLAFFKSEAKARTALELIDMLVAAREPEQA